MVLHTAIRSIQSHPNFSNPSSPKGSRKSHRIHVSTTSTTRMPSPLEQPWHQCAHRDETLHHLLTSGDHSPPERRGDSTLGGRQQVQEVRSSPSCSDSMSLRSGQRKRVLGEIQRAILKLEQESVESSEVNQELDEPCVDSTILQDIFHLKLIGEVFSPDRFVQRSPKHGLKPGQAFDLRLGHQFLCPKQRRKCIDHIVNNPYDLVVVTPSCATLS